MRKFPAAINSFGGVALTAILAATIIEIMRFLFAVCGAHYKTRPGLKYHIGHSHKDKDGNPVAFKDAARINDVGQFGSSGNFSGFGGMGEGPNYSQGRDFSQYCCLFGILCSISINSKP